MPAAEAITLTVNLSSTIQEVLAEAAVPGSASEDQRTVQHGNWNVDETFTEDSTPAPVRCLVQEVTIGGGGYTEIDLTAALTTANSAGEDLTGKNAFHFEVQTPEDNAAAVKICDQAASNKYDLFGTGGFLFLQKHGKLAMILQTSALLPAVAAGAKIIRFSGTPADVVRVKITFEA